VNYKANRIFVGIPCGSLLALVLWVSTGVVDDDGVEDIGIDVVGMVLVVEG